MAEAFHEAVFLIRSPGDRQLKDGEHRRPDSLLPEIIEYDDHPWFIGVQFHPELKSRPFAPHTLLSSRIGAAVEQSRLV